MKFQDIIHKLHLSIIQDHKPNLCFEIVLVFRDTQKHHFKGKPLPRRVTTIRV